MVVIKTKKKTHTTKTVAATQRTRNVAKSCWIQHCQRGAQQYNLSQLLAMLLQAQSSLQKLTITQQDKQFMDEHKHTMANIKCKK